MTRNEAKAAGLKRYFTGNPCSRGHICERFVSTHSCVECVQLHKAEYRSKPENKIKELEYKSRYRKENKEKISEYSSRYWHENQKAKDSSRKYKEEHKDEISKYNRDYYERKKQEMKKRNKERYPFLKDYFLAKSRERRAKLRGLEGSHTKEDVLSIIEMQSWLCVYCKTDLSASGYHVDHIVPLAKGGGNGKDNIQCLCARCNQRKSDKMPDEWIKIAIEEGIINES